jgi:AcrR family transcriptional regulator
MPPRPSQNLDQALLAAGLELFPRRGCAGLTVREVADAAGVNLGMFHYHFKSREGFLKALLQGVYESMYAGLAFEGARGGDPVENLRAAVRFMGRFVRQNRPFIARLMADALSGDAVALDFARNNMPRHLGVVHALIVAAQKAGRIRALPPPQALGLLAGATAFPILFAGSVAESGVLGDSGSRELHDLLLSDDAIDARIDLALSALVIAPLDAKRKPQAKASRAGPRAPRKPKGRP